MWHERKRTRMPVLVQRVCVTRPGRVTARPIHPKGSRKLAGLEQPCHTASGRLEEGSARTYQCR